jgi:hypothetical protein
MIKVTVKSEAFETKSGTSRKTGQGYSIREQTGYAHIGEEVRKITLSLGREQSVYAVGGYIVDDASFTTDNFGGLVVGRLVLKPLAAQVLATPKAS